MPSYAIWTPRPVFLTSTFTDMQAERDYLRDHVFPELAERLKARFRHLEPIDLRWGVETVSVDEAQAKELLVLKVCLAEIERSRPFLIALIGDRYGWVPPADRMSAAAQEAGFHGDLSGKSVTALEIEFGVLESPDQRRRSRFYFREPLPYERMEPAVAAAYSDACAGDPEAHDRLQALKARVTEKLRDWGMPDRVRTYRAGWDDARQEVTGLEAWGRQVLDDLWQDLEEETHANVQRAPDSWQRRESLVLEQFVETQCRDFVGREELIAACLTFAASPAREGATQGLCIVGPSGSGKSSLFAKLVRELGKRADMLLLSHAAGVSGRSVQVDAVLRRWIFELAEHLGMPDPTDERTPHEELEGELSRLLSRAAADRRVVCLLDALNQFERSPSGHYVTWFPRLLHPNVRLLAAAIPGTESAALAARPWVETLSLPPLTESEARDIVRAVCRRYHKTPSDEVVKALIGKRLPDGSLAAGSPLWLELAVEELLLLDADDFARADREFTGTPEGRLHALLLDTARKLPPDVESLYDSLLERTEELHGQVWAHGFANLIALGRNGWRESDLAALLPPLAGETAWNPLRFAALRRSFRAHLVQRGAHGQWDFFHAQTRATVLRRNLTDSEIVQQLHSAIADHLESLDRGDPVRETELMHHLIGADDRPRAARYYAGELTDGELAGAGRCLADHVTGFGDVEPNPGLAWVVSLPALQEIAPEQIGLLCHRYVFDLSDVLENVTRLSTRLLLLTVTGSVLERLAVADPGNVGLQRNLSVSQEKVGDLQAAQGDLGMALASYRAALGIAERLVAADPGNAEWQRNLASRQERVGNVQAANGNLGAALTSFRAALAIIERLAAADPANAGWQHDLSVCQERVGGVHEAQGDLEAALASYRAALAIAERLVTADPGNAVCQSDLASSQERVGDVQVAQGDQGAALASYQAALAIRVRQAVADPGQVVWQHSLNVSYYKLGVVQMAQGDLRAALASYRAALAIQERLATADPGNAVWQCDLARGHERVGDVQVAQGNLGAALASYRAALAIMERLAVANPENAVWQCTLASSHERVGDVQATQGNLGAAIASYRASFKICERLAAADPGNSEWQRDLARSYIKFGEVQEAQSDLRAALASYRVALAIGERMAAVDRGNAEWQYDLGIIHERIGSMLKVSGDLFGALSAFKRKKAIIERLAATDPANAVWQRDLSVSQEKVGDMQMVQGDLEAALASFRAALAIRERLAAADSANSGWQRDLSVIYNKVGDVQAAQNDLETALASYCVAQGIAERLAAFDPGNAEWQRDLSYCLENVGNVQMAQDNLGAALASYRTALAIRERQAVANLGNAEWQRDYSVSLEKFGDVHLAQGDLGMALASYRAALGIRKRLAAADPGNAVWQRDMWVLYWRMAVVAEQAGTGDAMAWWRKAYETLAGMKERGLFISPQDEQHLQQLRSKVDGNVSGWGRTAGWRNALRGIRSVSRRIWLILANYLSRRRG